jgi:transcriptional regulator with XRE-family HTH domain
MARLYQQNWTLDDLAREYHIGRNTARRYLTALGVTIRPRWSHPRGRRKLPVGTDYQIRQLKASGLTDREIAQRLGIERSTVTKRRQRLTLPGERA